MAKTVEWQRRADGVEYYVESNPPYTMHTADEVRNNTTAFQIKESVVGLQEQSLRESAPLGKGWVRVANWKPKNRAAKTEHARRQPELHDESFHEATTRKRIRAAYRVLGIAESDTTDAETSDLIEAWGQLLGSREAGAAFVRGKGNTK